MHLIEQKNLVRTGIVLLALLSILPTMSFAYTSDLLGSFIPPSNKSNRYTIVALNKNSGTEGVNPLNGGLFLREYDMSVMSRGLPVAISRYYKSKEVWEYDTGMKPMGTMGLGWSLHFGKRIFDSTGYFLYGDSVNCVFENSAGDQCELQPVGGGIYKTFDSQYSLMRGDTVFTKSGMRIIFADTAVSKIIDLNGNYCSYYSSSYCYPGADSVLLPDSAVSSSGMKIYVHSSYHINGSAQAWLIDSISSKAYSNQDYKVKYHYIASGDFYYLNAVLYPNGDSTSYGYKASGELIEVNNPSGGQIQYGYGMYYFSVPEEENPLKSDTLYTRSVDTLRVKDSPTGAIKTTLYNRVSAACWTNPYSCIIIDSYGNEEVYDYKTSGGPAPFKSYPGYGTLYKKSRYTGSKSTGTLIDSMKYTYITDTYPVAPTYCGPNVRMWETESFRGNKKYTTRYLNYDSYGNPGYIWNLGDTAVSWDDRYTCYKYLHNSYILSIQTSAPAFIRPNRIVTISMPYSSNNGVYKTRLIKVGTGVVDSQLFNPSVAGTRYYYWNTTGVSEGIYYFKTQAYDLAGNISISGEIAIEVSIDADDNSSNTTSSEISPVCNVYDEDNKHILDRAIEQYDSTASGVISNKIIYRYDVYGNIDSTLYSSYLPTMWENPHQAPRGLVTTIKRCTGGSSYDSTKLFYDQCGNLIKTINAAGDSTKAIYVANGDPDKYQYTLPCRSSSYVNGDSICSFAEYDSCTGLVTKSIGANSDTTRYLYDLMGRMLKTYIPGTDSAVMIRHYYEGAYPRAVVDSVMITSAPLSYISQKSFFNGFGQVIQGQKCDTSGYAIIVNTDYDSLNRAKKVSNPIKTTTSFGTFVSTDYWSTKPKTQYTYDAISRPVRTIYQDGYRDSISYGSNTVTVYNALDRTKRIVNNSFGSPDTVIDALNNNTICSYDHWGRVTGVQDATGKTTYYYYDYLGRIRGTNCPDASSSYTYDGNAVDGLLEYDNLGNITWSKNSKGEINYLYDDLSRVTEIDSASSSYPKVKYLYDTYTGSGYSTPPDSLNNAKGRLTSLVTVGVDTTWLIYDKLGQVRKKVYSYAGMGGGRDSLMFYYNTAGTCTLMTYPDGSTAKYRFNSAGQLREVPGFISGATYNEAGQPLNIYHSSHNMTNLYTYDNRLRPSYITAKDGNLVFQMKLLYTYWQDGNIKKIQDYVNSNYTHYYDYTSPDSSYDALGRLQRCAVGSTVLTYSYDDVGNRTQEVIGGTTNSLSYTSGTNKISSAIVSGTTYTYTYDNSGNVSSKAWGGGNQDDFHYNYANMLAKAVLDGGRTVTNYYGGGGTLKIKKTDSQTGSRYYAYNGIEPLCEYDSTGVIKKKYVYAMGKCIGMIDSIGHRYLYHHDIVGSIRLVTDTTGAVVNNYYYYPFGDSLIYSGTIKNDLQYTSKSNVAGMEAYDFSARYYDPAIGRFYSMDPLFNPATSPYAYCGNNPVSNNDPTGMATKPGTRSESIGYLEDLTAQKYSNPYPQPDYLDCAWDPLLRGEIYGLAGYSGSSVSVSWATWGGSSRSYTDMVRQTDPDFYASYVENSYISYKMLEAARNDYWRTFKGLYSHQKDKDFKFNNGELEDCPEVYIELYEETYFNVIDLCYNTTEVIVGPTMGHINSENHTDVDFEVCKPLINAVIYLFFDMDHEQAHLYYKEYEKRYDNRALGNKSRSVVKEKIPWWPW